MSNDYFIIAVILLLFLIPGFMIGIIGYYCNYVDKIKSFVEHVNDNLSGLIFIFLISYLFCRLLYNHNHNSKILDKYKRENNDNDKKFKTMRCIEDGDNKGRHNVYLIDEKEKVYHLISDYYTLKKLGFGSASRGSGKEEDDNKNKYLFSKKDYEIRDRIKIHNIIFDIGFLKDIEF